jgi:hypothetical protein
VAAEPSERELRLLRMRSQRLLAGEGEKTVAGAASAAAVSPLLPLAARGPPGRQPPPVVGREDGPASVGF